MALITRSAARWSAAGSFAPAAVYVAATRLRCAAGVGLSALVASDAKGKKPLHDERGFIKYLSITLTTQ